MQRVDAKAQSALDVKKQNLKDETKKRKELVKSMEEVNDETFVSLLMTCVAVNTNASNPFLLCSGQENAYGERK